MQAFDSPRTYRLWSRPLVRPSAALSVLFLAATVVGAAVTHRVVAPPLVYAACQSANQSCGLGDSDKTAVVDAAYFIPGGSSVTPVEPGSATTWSITAYWGEAPGGNCTDVTETATVDVSWNGSSWSTANFSGTTHITAAAACALSTCGSHSSSYRLYVDVTDAWSLPAKNIRQVVFAATSVPNGTDFDSSTCVSGSSRTPTASSFTGTDSGSFECAYNCNATGATVNLTYN